MEIQERNGFSIVGFIAQVLVLLLFVFVLMWLFPTKSYLENNGAAGAGTGSNSALSELLFNQNLLSMKDAAREYYTVKRMPSTNGTSKSLTLDEMIKNSMVVELVDASGNKCDREASYVKVTKVDNEYEMEISLTCGKVTKTIKTVVGCYNYCESGLCEKQKQEVTYYQYSKTIEGTSKWSNWSQWSKTEVTETSKREVEKKVVNEKVGTTTTIKDATATTTYSCPTGYVLSADKKTCSKVTSTTEIIDATAKTTYSCPSGYSLSADKKTCSKTTSTTDTVASIATTTYSCPSGYTKSSDQKSCSKTTYKYADLVPVYACSKGTLSGTNCIITNTVAAIPHVKVSFSCASGPCQTVSTIDYYYCSDSSYRVSGKNCVKTTTVAASISYYKCPTGYNKTSDGSRCQKASTSTIASTANTTYSCKSGYTLSADKKTCSKTTTTTDVKNSTATTTYSCPTGYTKDDKKCYKTTSGTSTIASSSATRYSCATGKLNSQNKCEITTDVYKDVTYYRYRTLTTTESKTVYKWSTSSNDQKLIKAGYKYTGVTKTTTK